MISKYRFHPACLLFPPLPDEELRGLADDIQANGQRDPVVRLQGIILDGRNRLMACEMADVEPTFVEWNGKGSPIEFIISANLPRRHLTSSQRAVIALGLLPLLEKEAKERQRLSPGRGKKVAKKLATFSGNGNGKASQLAARLLKTNAAYIEKAKVVKKQAPELLEGIRCGCLNVPDALIVAKLPKAKRQRIVKMIKSSGAEKLKEVLNATARVRNIAKNTLGFSCSKSMVYLRTPKETWERLSKEFCFTVDACASHDNHLLDRYWTEEEDGLRQDWTGEVVYCHPMFDGNIGNWVEKAFHSRCITVMLLPAATHTKYFHGFIYRNPSCTVEFLPKPKNGFRFGPDDGSEDDESRIGYIKGLMIVVFYNVPQQQVNLLHARMKEVVETASSIAWDTELLSSPKVDEVLQMCQGIITAIGRE
jgi:hypothetical protein